MLVGVLRNRRDRERLLCERWYRIPLARMPSLQFDYVAFYEPSALGKDGKRIKYYARICRITLAERKKLLQDEPYHPHAGEYYFRFDFSLIQSLAEPIYNSGSPRRISFGFVTLSRLRTARNILELFDVAPTEEIMEKAMCRAGIEPIPQFYIGRKKFRYRLDFAIPCRCGKVAIECDNAKAHSGKTVRIRDAERDTFLWAHGWKVVRLSEHNIVFHTSRCVRVIRQAIKECGGTMRGIEKTDKNALQIAGWGMC